MCKNAPLTHLGLSITVKELKFERCSNLEDRIAIKKSEKASFKVNRWKSKYFEREAHGMSE